MSRYGTKETVACKKLEKKIVTLLERAETAELKLRTLEAADGKSATAAAAAAAAAAVDVSSIQAARVNGPVRRVDQFAKTNVKFSFLLNFNRVQLTHDN